MQLSVTSMQLRLKPRPCSGGLGQSAMARTRPQLAVVVVLKAIGTPGANFLLFICCVSF